MEYSTEQQLCRQRECAASTSPSSSAAADALEAAAHLYDRAVESLLRGGARAQVVEDELEASVRLLDACAAARDGARAMLACVRDLEVAARRGCKEDAGVQTTLRACARLAKKACKDIKKHAHASKHEQQDGHLLKEARRATFLALERVMAGLSRRMAGPKAVGKWPTCMSRAFRRRARVTSSEGAEEPFVFALRSSKDLHDDGKALAVQKELRALGDTIEDVEAGLELVFRRLVQSRVCLLNMRST